MSKTLSQARHFHQSIYLEEALPPYRSRWNIFIVSGLVAGLVIWAGITPIQNISSATGHIIFSGTIQSVKHLEGGIVSEILTEEGQHVRKGDLLLRLDNKSFASERERAVSKQTALKIKAERLRAIGLGQKPLFEGYGINHQQMIEDQMAIYEMITRNRDDQRRIIEKQIEQEKAQLAIYLGQEKDLRHRLTVTTQQRDIFKDLFEKRLKTGSDYRATEENVSAVQKELNDLLNQMQQTKEAISKSDHRLIELDKRIRSAVIKEMRETSAELREVTDVIQKLEDKVKRLEVRAPHDGIVKGVKVSHLRAVVQPGEEIMQLLPPNMLEVEARVNPKNIADLRLHQQAMVTVNAYDSRRYGNIQGTVRTISSSTFLDEEQQPYYKAYITLDKQHVGSDRKQRLLSPGMTVTTDIHTGDKTILQYIFQPIYNAYKSAYEHKSSSVLHR